MGDQTRGTKALCKKKGAGGGSGIVEGDRALKAEERTWDPPATDELGGIGAGLESPDSEPSGVSEATRIHFQKHVKGFVLDPAWAFCSRGRGRSRLAGPAQLGELVETAAIFNVAIVCVTDLRRVRRGSGGYEAGGQRALTAAARA